MYIHCGLMKLSNRFSFIILVVKVVIIVIVKLQIFQDCWLARSRIVLLFLTVLFLM